MTNNEATDPVATDCNLEICLNTIYALEIRYTFDYGVNMFYTLTIFDPFSCLLSNWQNSNWVLTMTQQARSKYGFQLST